MKDVSLDHKTMGYTKQHPIAERERQDHLAQAEPQVTRCYREDTRREEADQHAIPKKSDVQRYDVRRLVHI